MAISLEQFRKSLLDSGILTETDLQDLLAALPAEKYPQDGEALARELVRQKKLTAFQAQQIHAGRGKALQLGNYRILDKLGQGGMGMVLKAEHLRMERIVALKVLSPTVTRTPDLVARFQREVKAAARLEHANIVATYDADEANGTHFMVMQFVAGRDLSSILKSGPMPIDQAVDCVMQAAKGLAFAHSKGIVHRDVKPANLLLDSEGTVKILDMGLARIEGDTGKNAELTQSGAIMGTVDYMAPEQALSTKNADARSDIYSLGITLWHLLTGRAVYEGDSLTARLLAHANQPIPSLRTVRPDVPEVLDAVFQKMIAKQAADRYQSMTEVITALEATRSIGVPAGVPSLSAAPSEDSQLSAFLAGSAGTNPIGLASATQARIKSAGAPPTLSLSSGSEGTDPDVATILSSPGSRPLPRQEPAVPTRNRARLLAAAGGGLLLLLAAVVFLLPTPTGTLRVEINDPEVEVSIKGADVVLKGADPQEIKLTPGDHILHVQRGDFEFDTQSLQLKKGETVVVKVELLAGEIRVASDGKVIGAKAAGAKAAGEKATGEKASREKTSAVVRGGPVEPAAAGGAGSAPPPAVAPFDAGQARRHQEAWAAYLQVPVEFTNTLGMTFRLIPPGEFTMGVDLDTLDFQLLGVDDPQQQAEWKVVLSTASPPHRVRLTRPFYMQTHEVTYGQFEQVLGKLPDGVDSKPPDTVLRQQVDLTAACAFCDGLSKLERRVPAYKTENGRLEWDRNASGYRLPTEAEWEFACRAGTTTLWFFGADPHGARPAQNLLDHQSLRRGGAAPANPFGLVDLYGGSIEHCFDRKAPYFAIESVDPFQLPDSGSGVMRGGTVHSGGGADLLRINSVVRQPHGLKHVGLGRIVLSIPFTAAVTTAAVTTAAGGDAPPAVKPAPPRWPLGPTSPDVMQQLLATNATLTLRLAAQTADGFVERRVNPGEALPNGPATLVGLSFSPNTAPTDDARLGLIATLTDLEVLEFNGGQHSVTSAGLLQLASLTKLRRLSLYGLKTEVGAASAVLESFPHLESIHLPFGETTADYWVAAVVSRRSIVEVNALRSDLRDGHLAQLEQMHWLQSLNLIDDHQLTPAAIEHFAAAVPGCRIVSGRHNDQKVTEPRKPGAAGKP